MMIPQEMLVSRRNGWQEHVSDRRVERGWRWLKRHADKIQAIEVVPGLVGRVDNDHKPVTIAVVVATVNGRCTDVAIQDWSVSSELIAFLQRCGWLGLVPIKIDGIETYVGNLKIHYTEDGRPRNAARLAVDRHGWLATLWALAALARRDGEHDKLADALTEIAADLARSVSAGSAESARCRTAAAIETIGLTTWAAVIDDIILAAQRSIERSRQRWLSGEGSKARLDYWYGLERQLCALRDNLGG